VHSALVVEDRCSVRSSKEGPSGSKVAHDQCACIGHATL
jgi:hypothetical protein